MTPAQRKALEKIRAHGYATHLISDNTDYYLCGPDRLQGRVVEALRREKLVVGVAVRPGTTHSSGYINRWKVTEHIVVPRKQSA